MTLPSVTVNRSPIQKHMVLWGGVLMLAVAIVVALSVGASGLTFTDAATAIWTRLAAIDVTADDLRTQTMVWELRLPRIALAVAAGAGLSVSGVAMQGLLRNPLVSPFTLGISSAAAFGASLALLLDLQVGGSTQVAMVGLALLVAVGCASIGLSLAAVRQMAPETLILIGLALSYLFAALASVVQYLATDDQLAAIVRWTFGTVNGASWADVRVVAALVALSLPVFVAKAGALNAVAFAGDDTARSLGVNVTALRLWVSLLAVIVAATVVSFTGVIGFVGLAGPHIGRLLIGADHRYLVPFSAISGALLLLVADTIGRSLFAPAVIPVGIVVAFIGAPIFLNLVLVRQRMFG